MNSREWDKRMGSKVENYIKCNIKMSNDEKDHGREMERNDNVSLDMVERDGHEQVKE